MILGGNIEAALDNNAKAQWASMPISELRRARELVGIIVSDTTIDFGDPKVLGHIEVKDFAVHVAVDRHGDLHVDIQDEHPDAAVYVTANTHTLTMIGDAESERPWNWEALADLADREIGGPIS